MKSDELYLKLKELAERMKVRVSERNLRDSSGVRARCGLCKVKGKYLFIVDKHLPVQLKIKELAEGLKTLPHEDVYVIPAIRQLLHSDTKQ